MLSSPDTEPIDLTLLVFPPVGVAAAIRKPPTTAGHLLIGGAAIALGGFLMLPMAARTLFPLVGGDESLTDPIAPLTSSGPVTLGAATALVVITLKHCPADHVTGAAANEATVLNS